MTISEVRDGRGSLWFVLPNCEAGLQQDLIHQQDPELLVPWRRLL